MALQSAGLDVCVDLRRGRSHWALPFLGELWGEVGGEDSCEDAFDIVSSACFLWRSKLPSSDKDRIFFKACGEFMPIKKKKGNNSGTHFRDWKERGCGSVAEELACRACTGLGFYSSIRQTNKQTESKKDWKETLNIKSLLCVNIQYCQFQSIYDLNVLCALLGYGARQGVCTA